MEQQFSSYPSSPSPPDDSPALSPGFGRRSFTVGAALGQGFGAFFKNLPAFLLIGMVILSPIYLYAFTRDPQTMSIRDLQHASMVIVYGPWFLGTLLTAALTFGVVEQMAGRRASIARCLFVGLRTMIPALLYLLLLVVGGFFLLFACGIGVAVLAAISPAIGVFGLIATGLLCLFFYVTLYVAVPALAIERKGVMDAIGCSQELTRGRRWQVFAVCLVTILAGLAFALLIRFALASTEAISTSSWRTMVGVQLVAQTVMGVLTATVTATVYVLLRKDRDGTDVGDLAKVFD